LIGPGNAMPNWPMPTATSSVAVTVPSEKPASFLRSDPEADREARKSASSGYERSVPMSQ
jgi:hypothetical protein